MLFIKYLSFFNGIQGSEEEKLISGGSAKKEPTKHKPFDAKNRQEKELKKKIKEQERLKEKRLKQQQAKHEHAKKGWCEKLFCCWRGEDDEILGKYVLCSIFKSILFLNIEKLRNLDLLY